MKNQTLILLLVLPIILQGYQIPSYIPSFENTWLPTNYTGDYVHPYTGTVPQNKNLTYYHINISHPNATDHKNYYGTPERPRRTIHQRETYAPGSVVQISGGPYTKAEQERWQVFIKGNGTPDNPIWIRGPDDGSYIDIQVRLRILGSYIFVENLHFNKDFNSISMQSYEANYLHHVVIRRNTLTGDAVWRQENTAAISIYGSPEHRFHDILIYENEISNLGESYQFGDPQTTPNYENDLHGVQPSYYTDNLWIFKNHIHRMGGDSVQVGEAQGHYDKWPRYTYIFDNDFHTNGENAVDVKKANFTIVANNKIHNYTFFASNRDTGCALVFHDKSDQSWVINNEIYDCGTGIGYGDAPKTFIIGNYFHNITRPDWDDSWYPSQFLGGQCVSTNSGSHGAIAGNTLVNYTSGMGLKSGNYDVFNNIFYSRIDDIAYNNTKDIDIIDVQQSKVHHNLFFVHDSSRISPSFTENVECVDCISGQDPLIIEGTVKLQDESPAINVGDSIQYIQDEFKSVFGTDLNVDFYGNDRVVTRPELGAYEKQCTQDASSCSPPHVFNLELCECVCEPPLDSQGNIVCPVNTAYSHEICECVVFNHDQQCQQDNDCANGWAKTCQEGKCIQLCENLDDCKNPESNYCRNTFTNPLQKSCQLFECEDSSQCEYPYICDGQSCVCDLSQQCSSPFESVNADSCSCQCDYSSSDFPCNNSNFQWNASRCECTCNIAKDRFGNPICPQGQVYDAENCACYLRDVPANCSYFGQVISAGNSAGNFAKFFFNGVEQQFEIGDSYNIAVYDPNTLQLKDFQNFNLFKNGHQRSYQFVDYIANIQRGDIVFLAIKLDGSYKAHSALYAALESVGKPIGLRFGWAASFAMIGQKQSTELSVNDYKEARDGIAYVEKCFG